MSSSTCTLTPHTRPPFREEGTSLDQAPGTPGWWGIFCTSALPRQGFPEQGREMQGGGQGRRGRLGVRSHHPSRGSGPAPRSCPDPALSAPPSCLLPLSTVPRVHSASQDGSKGRIRSSSSPAWSFPVAPSASGEKAGLLCWCPGPAPPTAPQRCSTRSTAGPKAEAPQA